MMKRPFSLGVARPPRDIAMAVARLHFVEISHDGPAISIRSGGQRADSSPVAAPPTLCSSAVSGCSRSRSSRRHFADR